jgi:uncharacterized lipoprotein
LSWSKRSGIPLLVVAVISLAGCKSLSCNAPPSYGNDASIPPLEVPVGLDAPDTRNALKIPDLNEPERPRGKGDPCLDEPPPYSAARRAGEPPAEDSQSRQ